MNAWMHVAFLVQIRMKIPYCEHARMRCWPYTKYITVYATDSTLFRSLMVLSRVTLGKPVYQRHNGANAYISYSFLFDCHSAWRTCESHVCLVFLILVVRLIIHHVPLCFVVCVFWNLGALHVDILAFNACLCICSVMCF